MVLDANTGEQVCTNCGYVMKENIEDTGPEWRNFAKEQGEDDRSRTGSPSSLALHDMGLSTVIGLESTDASGKRLEIVHEKPAGTVADMGSGGARCTIPLTETCGRHSVS